MKRRNVSSALSLIFVISAILTACGAPSASAPSTPVSAAPDAFAPATAGPAATAAIQPSAAAPAATDKTGGRLILVDSGDNAQLDPFQASWHAVAIYSVFDTLINYSLDFTSFMPGLADKWQISSDKLSLTLTLHPGVKFHDGTPMDAKAVKWNFDRYRDKSIASTQSAVLGDLVTDVQTPDASTVVLKMNKPYAPLFDFLAGLEIVSPTAYQQAGPDKFGQNPVGAGRWKVKEMVVNDHILFARNADYSWGPPYVDNKGAAYPDEFEIKTLKDEATIYAMLETGEADVASIPAQFVKKARANPDIEVVQGLNAGLDYLGFNTQHKPFDNANIRRAIGYAINRAELITVGYEGEADPIYGPLSPTEFGYSKEIEAKALEQSYNPEKAKEMLAAEGWNDTNGDGFLDKGADKMEFRLLYPSSDTYKRMAETIQAQLGDVGIKVNLEAKDEAALKDATKAGTHEMFMLYFGLLDPRILCFMFCSAGIGGTNRTRYANPDLDKLLAAADTTVDPTERKQKVADVMQMLIKERPSIPLLAVHTFTGYRKDKVAGLKFDALGGVIFNDAYLLKK
jgi:peptide/nickel transport system substrate-binding protein